MQPPRKAIDFLRWFCRADYVEEIEGDLIEIFGKESVEAPRWSKWKFTWRVMKYLRPGFIRSFQNVNQPYSPDMYKSYFRIATRAIAKRKMYSFINAIGLSIGIAFSVLIYLYIQDEKSFDQFHTNKEHIFRLDKASYSPQAAQRGEYPVKRSAYVPLPLGEALKDEVPEVQYLTRFSVGGREIFRYGEKVFSEEITLVDADFFRMFSFPLIAGSPDHLFSDKHEIVLTPEIAEKYFGNEDPVGKVVTLRLQGEKQFTVTGVIEAPPANSSLSFKILVPIESHPRYARNLDQWGSFSFPTFIQLHPQASIATLRLKADTLIRKHMGEMLDRWHKEGNVPAGFSYFEPHYTNLADIHLTTDVGWEKVSNPKNAWILGGIAVLIIVIASINYISLALTTSAARKIEVGIRKVVGAYRGQLIIQFGAESLVLATISMFIGLGLVALFLPIFNEYTGKGISLTSFNVLPVIGTSFTIALAVGLLAGSYPAFFLSGFLPVKVLKGGFTSKFKAGFARPLVVFQFSLSAFMMISSVIMYRQMEFITTKDLGYDKEHVLVIPTQAGQTAKSDKLIEQFRNRLITEPAVVSVSGTSASFSQGYSQTGYKINGEDKFSYVYRVDPEYINLLSLRLKEGRNFDPRIASDTNAVVINEALAQDMGWENPLEENLNWRQDTLGLGANVIGVLKDYHFMSLERNIEPMFLSLDKKGAGYLTTMLVKLSPGNVSEKIESVRSAWKELYPDKPFDYSFMDEDLTNQYRSYERWMSITTLSTGFAIFIACLGLFGLAGINAASRTKEIGIRKVMGAELSHIFMLLNKQFVWLAVIAFLFAAPLSWYVMTRWLSSFKYAIAMSWELFAISMLLGLTLALLTVSYHAISASLINPSKTLKYE